MKKTNWRGALEDFDFCNSQRIPNKIECSFLMIDNYLIVGKVYTGMPISTLFSCHAYFISYEGREEELLLGRLRC